MAGRILKGLEIVTWCVDDLAAAIDGWSRYLDFQVVDCGKVSEAAAGVWDTPAVAGCPSALLQPASGAPVFMRFIETGERYGYDQPLTAGWTAAELLVEDPDALADKLAGTPFQRLAGPGDLFPGPKAPRAMQMTGPCGELLYFTRILPGGSRYGMKPARSFVDRPFIITVAGNSMAGMEAFYGEGLGMRVMEPMSFINGVLAHAGGLPPDTVFPTAISPIPGRKFLIELDECPANLPPRPVSAGLPPPGMAIASFAVENLDAVPLVPRSPRLQIDAWPYEGRRVAVTTGAAGEWLELIETPIDRKSATA